MNWRLVTLPYNRRRTLLRALLGSKDYCPIDRNLDILLSADFDYHGFDRGPQIAHLHDLAAVLAPQHCSLAWHGRLARRRQLQILAASNVHICTISEFTKRQLLKCEPRFCERVDVVANGIDAQWHREDVAPGQPARAGLPSRYWVWWGQITKRKNVHGMLHAYTRFLKEYGGANNPPGLLLIGDVGRDSGDIPGLVERLSGHVRWMPSQEPRSLVKLVSASEGLIFPSFYEGFGLPVVEALAQGLPVIASNSSSIPEVAGGHASLVDPADIEQLAQAMKEMAARGKVDDEAANRRRAWARRFTYRDSATKYSQIIDRLTGRTSACDDAANGAGQISQAATATQAACSAEDGR
jgi:glycosyltransferase involved in cell wall biosynthesis